VPNLVTAKGLDSQIVFNWANPKINNFAGTTIVRKEGDYPGSPQDGQIIYHGISQTFTDSSVNNGQTYYYALFSYNTLGFYSNPIHVSTIPNALFNEIKEERNVVAEHALPTYTFSEELKIGDSGIEVVHLQSILNTIAKDISIKPVGSTDGYFGSSTKKSLQSLQNHYGLNASGVTDESTRKLLHAISSEWILDNAPSDIAILDHDLQRGDHEKAVRDLQEFLAFEGSYPGTIVSDYFGPLTQKGTKNFQKSYGITPVSGYVGIKTRHIIKAVLGL